MTARLKCKNTTTVAGLTMLLRFYDSTIKIYSLYFVECTRKFQNGWKWKRYGVWVCFRFEIRLACADYRRREESGRLPGEKRCNLDLAFFSSFPFLRDSGHRSWQPLGPETRRLSWLIDTAIPLVYLCSLSRLFSRFSQSSFFWANLHVVSYSAPA